MAIYSYFVYRLYPTKAQARRLEAALEVSRVFFNLLLDERRAAYEVGVYVGLTAQLRRVAEYRRLHPEVKALHHSHTLQEVARSVDRSWATWMKRGRKGVGP